MKKSIKISIIILFILFLIFGLGFFLLYTVSRPPVDSNNPKNEILEVRIEVPYGMSIYQISSVLKENNLIRNEKFFYYCARFPKFTKILFPKESDLDFSLKSGVYYVKNE